MITVDRDSARRGFEIGIFNRVWFIGDNKISKHPSIMALIRIMNFPNYIYWKFWITTHKKQIEINKKRHEEWIERFKNNA